MFLFFVNFNKLKKQNISSCVKIKFMGEPNKFVKNIPNMITMMRIVGSVAILFLVPLSLPFFIVYSITAITDALDGFIARKYNLTSRLGSIIDSIADILFYLAMAISIFPTLLRLFGWEHWSIVIIVTAIHLINYIICAIKFHRFSSIHTYADKMQGALICFLPFFLIGEIYWLYTSYVFAGGLICFYSAIELFLIHILAKEYSESNKSIFLLKRNNSKIEKNPDSNNLD